MLGYLLHHICLTALDTSHFTNYSFSWPSSSVKTNIPKGFSVSLWAEEIVLLLKINEPLKPLYETPCHKAELVFHGELIFFVMHGSVRPQLYGIECDLLLYILQLDTI